MRTSLLLVAAAFTTLAVGGCQDQFHDVMPDVGVVPIEGMSQTPTDTSPAVDIQNHRGSVTVIVDPKAAAPSVVALPHTSGPVDKTVRWTAAAMQEDNGRPVLRVLSSPAETGAPDVPVNLTITLPECGGVRVLNDGGPVTLVNVSGAIEVRNSLGANDGRAILIETPYALNAPILLRSERGSVELRAGHGSAGQLTATTQAGNVNFDGGHSELSGVKLSKSAWSGTVNNGGSDQRIDVERGDVLIRIGMDETPRLPGARWLGLD